MITACIIILVIEILLIVLIVGFGLSGLIPVLVLYLFLIPIILEEKVMVKQELYKLLYEWFITETCEDCQHISTFLDGDNRHPCNRCECYEKFRIDDRMKEDLKEKVKQIINVVNGKEGKE